MSQGNGKSNSEVKDLMEDEMEDWSELMDMSDSEVKEDLETLDETEIAEKLHTILDEKLATCEVNDLDRRIFSTYLTDASKTFVQLITEIDKKLLGKRRNESDIKAKLKTCTDLLECWQKCMKHLKTLKNVSITQIKSFPNILFNVVKSALSFCEMSEMKYGEAFTNFSEEIAIIFQKSNEILNSFLSVSDTVINFNVEEESELNILSTIINEIGDTSVMVNRLDLKTITGIWKQFGKLATIHGEKINLKYPERITQHFKSLAENIVSLIFSSVNDNQQKVNENRISCGKILLKILNKLWNIYYLSVTDEVANSIVKLLVQMYRYSSPCLIAMNVDSSIVKFIKMNITTDLDTLLNFVFNDEHVFKAFFEFERGDDTEVVGYHLLTLNIMRKLIKSPYDIQRKWVLDEPSILDVAFTNIDLLQLEICLGKLQVEVTRNLGESPKTLTIYEETFTMCWGLICQVTPSDFGRIENLLVKYLMSGNYWSSLLTVDVWCIISRCASTQLCYDHLKYLLKVYERLSERENSLEVVFLSFLIRRIYRTLSENKKDFFVEKLDDSGNDFWIVLSQVLTPKGKSIVKRKAGETGNDISKNFQLLKQKPSIKSWTYFISLLKMTEIYSHEQDKQIMNTLSNIWNSIVEVIEFCEGIDLILISELMTALFHCHIPGNESFKDGTVSSILKLMTTLLPYAPPYIRIQLLNWLKNVLIHTTDNMSRLSVPIAELYVQLLQDETPWVRQEAFEYFNDFTRSSPNENLVGSVLNIIIDKTALSESLSAYISRTSYYKLSGFSNTEAYFRQLVGGSRKILQQHTCYEINEREDKFPKLDDSPGILASSANTDFNVNKKIESLCDQLDDLSNCKNEISQESFERLRQTFLKICDQRAS
ncbi:uncharacterized protein C1orf112 homolog isoform X2 [Leptopilina heterotoma]|uniref:uncharacterized protein C1orf112 homolog isoform X2 n=1 Tax=Leptopilina heterotoma TaxID=63436 RepID=UPI001CA9E9C1|nr:uncharacterized protein C1orf112 homolog isoform X2 [Leptopilina heterotoma]